MSLEYRCKWNKGVSRNVGVSGIISGNVGVSGM